MMTEHLLGQDAPSKSETRGSYSGATIEELALESASESVRSHSAVTPAKWSHM